MRIIYFGTGTFALPTLKRLSESIVLVVTQPDRPTGRGLRLNSSPVKQLAVECGLPVATPEKSRAPEFVEQLEAAQADALVVASYGQILSQRVLDSTKRGGINLHGSVLPKYRGAAPIQRCILEGDRETGVTLMQMDRGMDTGAIIDISRTKIGDDETYGELQDRLAEIAAQLAEHWMYRIVGGDYSSEPQNSELATVAPKIEKQDAELCVAKDSVGEYYRFRAFTPAPGAFMRTSNGVLRIWSARNSIETAEAGAVIRTNPLTIAFATGALELHEVQPEGKKRMTGKDFANGARLSPGTRLVFTETHGTA